MSVTLFLDSLNHATYSEIIAELARESFGLFAPTDVSDDNSADQKRVRVAFRHGDRSYGFEAENRKWVDEDALIGAINAALADAGKPVRFICIDDVKDRASDASYVIATPAAVERARAEGLLGL